jgi:hypothetical protein
MVPQLVPVANAMKNEMMKESVGSHSCGMPPTIQLEKRRSAPTATMIAPEAHAKVSTMRAGTVENK